MAFRLRVALTTWGVVALVVSLSACTTTTPPAPTTIAIPTTTGSGGVTTSPTGATAPTTTTTSGSTTTYSTDEQLAIEAVQRYYKAFNEALVTLKTTEMRKLFYPGCLVCEKDANTIDKMARTGERVTGGATILSNFTPTLRSGNLLGLRADSYSEAMIIRDATGKVIVDQKAAKGTKRFTILHLGDTWIMEGIS